MTRRKQHPAGRHRELGEAGRRNPVQDPEPCIIGGCDDGGLRRYLKDDTGNVSISYRASETTLPAIAFAINFSHRCLTRKDTATLSGITKWRLAAGL